ncbi:ribonuclease Z [Ferroglobus placidus DSM 10642]|uniref:Ribonuclease Z n=1 Tax=Ferroglobus placidus (strain DSM 10642 / AEDII12DO) TaxID=589924 RepID=D3S260_FERPA|nr:ribonuclease Z [Ferroglobus placidus]ADC66551.1 ribonuclease Z [Ferroglobus placidus DSM 10642]
MFLKVTFLGTSGTVPSVDRNTSSILLNYSGCKILFDCGEGTQRQMMKAKTGFNIEAIFITHLHTDHFIGVFGLLETMSLNSREKPLSIYTPNSKFLRKLFREFGYHNLGFPVRVVGLRDGDFVRFENFKVLAFKTDHIVESLGYAFVEDERRGKFNVEKARELGIPPGPLYSKLARGEAIEFGEKIITPDMVLGEKRPGWKVVYTGDTAPVEKLVEIAKNADLLIHDAAFTSELDDWAKETKHSTARDAAEIAKKANVKKLVLTHISARYSKEPEKLLEEAKKIFENVVVAEDFMEIELERD